MQVGAAVELMSVLEVDRVAQVVVVMAAVQTAHQAQERPTSVAVAVVAVEPIVLGVLAAQVS